MIKKMFALMMATMVLGFVVGGCSAPAEEAKPADATKPAEGEKPADAAKTE